MNNLNLKKSFPEAPPHFHNRIALTLSNLPEKDEKEQLNMENKTIKSRIFNKRAIFALVAIFALATTVYAAGKMTSTISHSSTKPQYTSMPSKKEVKNLINADVKLIESFSNGFSFSAGHVVESEDQDAQGGTINKYSNISLEYKNGEEKIMLFLQPDFKEGHQDEQPIASYKEIPIYFMAQTYKNLPESYEMTAEDKADMESGKFIFNVGCVDKVEIVENQFATWEENGAQYMLMGQNSTLTQKDFIAMAEEIIDAK